MQIPSVSNHKPASEATTSTEAKSPVIDEPATDIGSECVVCMENSVNVFITNILMHYLKLLFLSFLAVQSNFLTMWPLVLLFEL